MIATTQLRERIRSRRKADSNERTWLSYSVRFISKDLQTPMDGTTTPTFRPSSVPKASHLCLYGKDPFVHGAGKHVNFPQVTHLGRLLLHIVATRTWSLMALHALRLTHLRISYLTDVSEELENIASKFLILAHGEPEPCFSRGRTVHDTKPFKPRTTEPACPRWLSLESLHQVWQVHGRLRQLRGCGGTTYQSVATSRLRHLSLGLHIKSG